MDLQWFPNNSCFDTLYHDKRLIEWKIYRIVSDRLHNLQWPKRVEFLQFGNLFTGLIIEEDIHRLERVIEKATSPVVHVFF